jgi:hypothetical protein
MSVAELKRAVDGLSPDERLELADYLRRRAKQDDPQREAELGKPLDRCLEDLVIGAGEAGRTDARPGGAKDPGIELPGR